MTWAKLGDTFIDDPDLLALPRGVRLLHVEAIVWCCKHLTDGQIRGHVLPRLTDEPDPLGAAAQLVAAGFWRTSGEGWEVVGFLDDQPSRQQVEQRHEDSRLRQERSRRHRAGDHSQCMRGRYCPEGAVTRDSSRDSHGLSPSESQRPDPTRPVPTRREGREGKVVATPRARLDSLVATPRASQGHFTVQMPGGQP